MSKSNCRVGSSEAETHQFVGPPYRKYFLVPTRRRGNAFPRSHAPAWERISYAPAWKRIFLEIIMLKKVKIQAYKSISDLEIPMSPLMVLFGPNAAGKSNFLDALQLLSRLATLPRLIEAFTPPYRGNPLESFAFDTIGIKGLLAKGKASFSIEVEVALSPSIINTVTHQIQKMEPNQVTALRFSELCYRLEIEILPQSGLLRVADESLIALNQNGTTILIEKKRNKLYLHNEAQTSPSTYELYLDHTLLSLPLYPPHYPHLVALRQELKSWLFFYFEPRERMRAKNPVKEVHHIGLMGEELAAFLNTLRSVDERQFFGLEKSLTMLIPSLTGIEVAPNEFGELELRVREGEISMPARVLSEGTLRLLGLLALGSVVEPTTLIGFEEPENGIHPRRIHLVAQLLKSRATAAENQLIVTTHSPQLVDEMPHEFLYSCYRQDGWTKIKALSDLIAAKEESLPISERLLRGDFDA